MVVDGDQAEFSPVTFKIHRLGDEEWYGPYLSNDLAGICSRLGVDVKWKYVDIVVKDWLNNGCISSVLKRLSIVPA